MRRPPAVLLPAAWLLWCCCALLLPAPLAAQTGVMDDAARDPAMERARQTYLLDVRTGDLPEMLEVHRVRALVVFNRTEFFIGPDGEPRGLMRDLCALYEKDLNRGRKKGDIPVSVTLVPSFLDELVPALLDGRGDFIAHNLTVTPERARLVDFTEPLLTDVREVLVRRKGAPALTRLEDLTGTEVHVAKGSSQAEHLRELNRRLEAQGLAPAAVREAAPPLGTENLLEMLSAGLLDTVACDDSQAALWTRIFRDLVVQSPSLAEGGSVAWAVRKDNPRLLAGLNRIVAVLRRDQTALRAGLAAYYRTARWLTGPAISPAKSALLDHFEHFADRYGFDWRDIMAQAFQESGLDNRAVSPVGAVGVMQVLPATGRDLGIPDVLPAPNNIHAGTKYMALLREQLGGEAGLTPENRFYFALAAYNAGPHRVKRLRAMAAESGLDPDVWFGSVERVALKVLGPETATYVRNIHNYAVAYRLSDDIYERREEAREALKTKDPDGPGRP